MAELTDLVHKVAQFLALPYGDGSGCGSGYGYGYGYGYGCGSGCGSGYGYGYGDGSGSGIAVINGHTVWDVDGLETIFTSVRGQVAKGFLVTVDLTLQPTYIVRVGNSFAHGATVAQARADALAKHWANVPVHERVALFLSTAKPCYSGHEWFEIHGQLTLSCLQGRQTWVAQNQIDLDAPFTIAEFCKLVKGAYGSDVIEELARQAVQQTEGQVSE